MSLQWSGDNISLATFVSHHAQSLPKVICVTGGFAGADEIHCISSGETLLIKEVVLQHRYVARCDGEMFSIPADYSLKFQLVDKRNLKSRSALQLKEAVFEAKLDPLKWGEKPRVVLENNSTVFVTRSTSKDSKRFNIFNIVDEYNEKYLRAFIIRNMTTESVKTAMNEVLLPVYLGITVDVALGFKSDSQGNFFTGLENLVKTQLGGVRKSSELCRDIVSLRQKQPLPASEDQSHEKIYEPLLFFKTDAGTKPVDDDQQQQQQLVNKRDDRNHALPDKTKLVNDAPPVIPKPRSNTYVTRPSPKLTTEPPRRVPTPPSAKAGQNEPIIPTPDYTNAPTSSAAIVLNSIPDDISYLSVADLAECLSQLNLSKYVDVFATNTVDGKLLRCLDEDLLIADFGMSRIEARRMMMFALHGWRPNQDGRRSVGLPPAP